MSTSEAIFDTSLEAVLRAAENLPTDVALVKELDDRALLVEQRRIAEAAKKLNACASLLAGEIGHRSRRDLGYSGLAQREGFRTPEALVQFTTGSTAREATTLVQVGTMVHDSMIDPTTDTAAPDAPASNTPGHEPWLRAVGSAVTNGDVIRRSGTSHPERAGRTDARRQRCRCHGGSARRRGGQSAGGGGDPQRRPALQAGSSVARRLG